MEKCPNEKSFEPCRMIPVLQITVRVEVNRCVLLLTHVTVSPFGFLFLNPLYHAFCLKEIIWSDLAVSTIH